MKVTTNRSTLTCIGLGLGALSFLPSVAADFAQCIAGWEWSYNSGGQNPCEIAGSLQAPCLGFSVYELGPLGDGSNYVTPQADDEAQKKCGCNTVVYSLYAACSVCQRNDSTPITWAFWSQFCDSVFVTQYPFDIPYNASVPHWAFVNYTDSAFDPTRARAAGRDPEATPSAPPVVSLSSTTSPNSPPSTVSLTGSGTPIPGSSNPPSPTSTGSSGENNSGNNVDENNRTNVGAIAGGVVGGVVGLAAIAALVFIFLKKRNGKTDNILEPDQMAYNPARVQSTYDQPKLYNPADPTTFPTPVSGGDSSHSGGYTTNPFQTGRYNGAAEL